MITNKGTKSNQTLAYFLAETSRSNHTQQGESQLEEKRREEKKARNLIFQHVKQGSFAGIIEP